MINVKFEASNQADWIIYFEATDDSTGDLVVWTGASIVFDVQDRDGCATLLTASTDLGTITLPTPTTIQVQFTPSQMQDLCPGTYPVGCTYLLNSVTSALFVGSVSIYDGIASI